MKLPLVRRARLDLLAHNFGEAQRICRTLRRANDRLYGERDEARSQSANWKALFDAERIRCEALTEKLVNMKQQGFSTAAERQALPPRPPSRIDEAIAEKAGANGSLRRHLTRWASQRQAMNVPDDEIVDALLNWKDPDADEAEA